MEKLRKTFSIIMLLILICFTFTGCIVEVEYDSEDYASIWCNENCISVYSPIESRILVEATVEYSGNTITVVKEFYVLEDQNKIITAEEFNQELFDEDAKIISADIMRQTYDNMMELWLAIIIPVGFTIFMFVVMSSSEKSKRVS